MKIVRTEEYYARKKNRQWFAAAVKASKPLWWGRSRHRRPRAEVKDLGFRGFVLSNTSWPKMGTQEREKARRLRRIERGQLTKANGLVRP